MSNSTQDNRNVYEIAQSIESLRMRGLAPATTLGVGLRDLSRDQLLEIEAKAKAEKASMVVSLADAAARTAAHVEATTQSRKQALAREAERMKPANDAA